MTDFAPLVSAFLQTYLPCERRASRHTVLNYTDSIRLLVVFVAGRLGVQPCRLQVEHFTVEMVLDFLEFLERDRGNTIGTRNVRLAAVKSLLQISRVSGSSLPGSCLADTLDPKEAC